MSESRKTLLRAPWQVLSRVIGRDEPPPDAGQFGRALWTDPRPLILPRQKLLVVFSPKSACTTVLVWFLHQIGHTRAARDYAAWPHRYRTEVYYKSALYRRSYERNDLSEFSLLRIVRDPFERAVSSFRHVQRGKLAARDMARKLGRRDIPEAGLSFSEFLDFLERCDLRTCDPHFGLQQHPIEELLPTRTLINASSENLLARLNVVETEIGLPVTDFSRLEWLQRTDRKHTHQAAPVIPLDTYHHRFTRDDALSGSWPPYSAFLTRQARERLARLYASDIAAYGDAAAPRSRPPKLELVRNSTPEPSA